MEDFGNENNLNRLIVEFANTRSFWWGLVDLRSYARPVQGGSRRKKTSSRS